MIYAWKAYSPRECTHTYDRKVPEKIRNWWIFEDLQIFTDFYARHFFPALYKIASQFSESGEKKKCFLSMHDFNANSRVPFKKNSVTQWTKKSTEPRLNRFRKHAKFTRIFFSKIVHQPICFALFAMQFQLCVFA
jgi:hypothetical protein